MRETFHERLSALDQSFLSFETRNAYMHVALTAIFEPQSLTTPDGGIDVSRIRRHIAARLPLVPRYRQRLMRTPLVSDAIWVDDDGFDLGYHVRHASLPRPGGERQLQRRCAEILERPLDRTRPLWEVWIIEGLAGGRFAMLAKVHHCMVDGVAGVDILAALLGTEPISDMDPVAPWTPRPAPSEGALLAHGVLRRGRASVDALRGVRDALRSPAQAGREVGTRTAALVRLLGHLGQAPSTPFNQPIGPHRRIDWLAFDLATIKAIRNRLGGTINDVVLATVAGAVGRFLARRRAELDAEFRTVVPVSVRAADERGVPGNRVSVWLTTLPVREPDAARRLAIIRAMTAELKDTQHAMGATVLAQAAEWTTANLINLAAQFINRARRFNLIVTNVPGPPVPFYLLDAPMVAAYPHLPLFENQGLGIALFSYAGTLFWGVGADWNQMPDLGEFMKEIAQSFDDLCSAAGVPCTASPPHPAEAAAAEAQPPRLTVYQGAAPTIPKAAVVARRRAARARAASAVDDRRRGSPAPRSDTALPFRSTGQPGVPR